MKKLEHITDLFLLAFWSVAYFLKTIVEIPWLWLRSKWMILVALLLLTGCQFHKAPSGGYFPYGWGKPPAIQTKDYVELPDGYGHGSSTLKIWIELNKQRDRINSSLNSLPENAGVLAE